MKPKIIITIDGGLIQNILSDVEIDSFIIDYDIEGYDLERDENPVNYTMIPYEVTGSNGITIKGEDKSVSIEYTPEVNPQEVERLYEIIVNSL